MSNRRDGAEVSSRLAQPISSPALGERSLYAKIGCLILCCSACAPKSPNDHIGTGSTSGLSSSTGMGDVSTIPTSSTSQSSEGGETPADPRDDIPSPCGCASDEICVEIWNFSCDDSTVKCVPRPPECESMPSQECCAEL